MYASKTRAHIMNLKECMTHFTKRNGTISEYLQDIKAYELTIINSKLDDVDLIINSLNDLGPEYHNISTIVHARETPSIKRICMISLLSLKTISKEMKMSHKTLQYLSLL
ncbi:hypothetical protein MTR_4g029990 [Medicago truncatula]|uniref:Uncharacterized protein n=1 Tax=Medicago truncatula TaxID=3880 RepID=G7JJL1_MEDTR|nr:hypothetical protein MTR_4g029990 [Medicago truncatula]